MTENNENQAFISGMVSKVTALRDVFTRLDYELGTIGQKLFNSTLLGNKDTSIMQGLTSLFRHIDSNFEETEIKIFADDVPINFALRLSDFMKDENINKFDINIIDSNGNLSKRKLSNYMRNNVSLKRFNHLDKEDIRQILVGILIEQIKSGFHLTSSIYMNHTKEFCIETELTLSRNKQNIINISRKVKDLSIYLADTIHLFHREGVPVPEKEITFINNLYDFMETLEFLDLDEEKSRFEEWYETKNQSSKDMDIERVNTKEFIPVKTLKPIINRYGREVVFSEEEVKNWKRDITKSERS